MTVDQVVEHLRRTEDMETPGPGEESRAPGERCCGEEAAVLPAPAPALCLLPEAHSELQASALISFSNEDTAAPEHAEDHLPPADLSHSGLPQGMGHTGKTIGFQGTDPSTDLRGSASSAWCRLFTS